MDFVINILLQVRFFFLSLFGLPRHHFRIKKEWIMQPQYAAPFVAGNWTIQNSDNASLEGISARVVIDKNGKGELYSVFDFVYGKLSADIEMERTNGAWYAFWVLGEPPYLLPETDIFEYCGNWKHRLSCTHHYGYDYTTEKKMTHLNVIRGLRFRPGNRVYNYSVEMTPYDITWKINEVTVKRIHGTIASNRKHILFTANKSSKENNYCNCIFDEGTKGEMRITNFKLYKNSKDI